MFKNGLDTRGSWFSLFQVSRGSHRKKLNLISRYHTHHRARGREALRFPPAIRFSALRAFGGRRGGSALRPGRPLSPAHLANI